MLGHHPFRATRSKSHNIRANRTPPGLESLEGRRMMHASSDFLGPPIEEALAVAADSVLIEESAVALDLASQLSGRNLQVRVNNNMQEISQNLLPILAAQQGVNRFSIEDRELARGNTDWWPCHTQHDWTFSITDISVEVPINSDTVGVEFADGNRVNTDWDMDDFDLSATFRFHWPKNDSLYCRLVGSDYNIQATVDVTGLRGELDVSLDANLVDSGIEIEEIEKLRLSVDQVDFRRDYLNRIVDGGLQVASLFGTDCSDLDSCTNMAIDRLLQENQNIQNHMVDTFDGFLDQTLNLEGDLTANELDLDYSFRLDGLHTSDNRNRLTTEWRLDVDSSDELHDCALELTQSHYEPPLDYTTGEEIEVVVPFSAVNGMIYQIGRQGAFCFDSDWALDGLTVAASVRPDGAFRIDSGDVSDDRVELVMTIPVSAEFNAGDVLSGTATADIEIHAQLTLDDDAGLQLEYDTARVNDLTGTVTVTLGSFVQEIDTEIFADDVQSIIQDQLAASFSTIPLLPKVLNLDSLAPYSLELAEIAADDVSVAFGFGLTTPRIAPGESMTSTDGRFDLRLQHDGNLVLYYVPTGGAMWSSQTAGNQVSEARVQGDGNFVLYHGQTVVWSTDTAGTPGARLVVQNDGNAVIYAPDGRPVWATNTEWGADIEHRSDKLVLGQELSRGQSVDSADNRFQFVLQTDGNLVLYYRSTGVVLWASGTNGRTVTHARMQGDGNLVLYNGRTAVWSTRTAGNPGAQLVVQNDGNVVLYRTNGRAVWSTRTSWVRNIHNRPDNLVMGEQLTPGQSVWSANRRFRFVLQTDGNLVLYDNARNRALWATGTNGRRVTRAVMQVDGNLVLYNGHVAVWSTRTRSRGATLVVQDDGNVVLYGVNGRPVWATNTSGR